MVHEAPTARAAAQVPPAAPAGRENGCGVPPPKVKVPPARAPLPVLLTVSVCAALVVPNGTVPNASEVDSRWQSAFRHRRRPPTRPRPRPTAPFLGALCRRSQGSAPRIRAGRRHGISWPLWNPRPARSLPSGVGDGTGRRDGRGIRQRQRTPGDVDPVVALIHRRRRRQVKIGLGTVASANARRHVVAQTAVSQAEPARRRSTAAAAWGWIGCCAGSCPNNPWRPRRPSTPSTSGSGVMPEAWFVGAPCPSPRTPMSQ